MSRLTDWLAEIEKQGYHGANARARLCQDIVLEAISKGRLRRNVTIKGGVVMRSLTGDVRRATQDMDIDFIRYSLADDSIQRFIQELNVFDDFHIAIAGAIEPLRHQDYHGKCVNIRIYDDEGTIINSKIDFGVHKDLTIQQEEYCFDVCMDEEGASLLMNSREQMLTEKLRSLLKFGPLSTRFKDIFDLCYLVDHIESSRLDHCLHHYIFDDDSMRENTYADIVKRLESTFKNRRYQSRIKTSRKNWLGIPETAAFQKILDFFQKLTVQE